MAPKVAIVILNWNGWKDTIECLDSVYRISYDPFFVIVIDNGSSDESVLKLTEYCRGGMALRNGVAGSGGDVRPSRLVELERSAAEAGNVPPNVVISPASEMGLVLILNERNYGFAEGCNIGIRFALSVLDSDYILLLNNDTVVDKDLLREMVRVGESDERVGIMGPKIYYYDLDGRRDVIWSAGGRISPWRELILFNVGIGEVDKGQYDVGGETDWCTGAALLLKKELAKMETLNPAYLFGIEDVEYCLNARRRGYRVVYVPSAKVWHKVGVSWRKLNKRIGRDISRHFYFIRENFSSAVYAYHMVLFFAVVLPRWAVTYWSEGSDEKTLLAFVNDMKRLFKYIVSGDLKG